MKVKILLLLVAVTAVTADETSLEASSSTAKKLVIDEFKDVLPSIERKNLLEIKCSKRNVTYTDVVQRVNNFLQCVSGVVNITTLYEEITLGILFGTLKGVFSKYCAKKNVLTQCISDLVVAVKPFLEPKEVRAAEILKNVTNNIITYVCYEEGNYTAMFFKDEGLKCFDSKKQEIDQCLLREGAFTDIAKLLNPDRESIEVADEFSENYLYNYAICGFMDDLHTCTVHKLAQCKKATPSRYVKDLLNSARKATPCEKPPKV